MSYYDLLSITSTASTDEVKKAYRKKALELHPDRCCKMISARSLLASHHNCRMTLSVVSRNPDGAKEGHKAFKAVSEAYEVGRRCLLPSLKIKGIQLASFMLLAGPQGPWQKSYI